MKNKGVIRMKYSNTKKKIRLTSLLISILMIGSMIIGLDAVPSYASTVRYKGIDASVKTVDLNSVQLSWKPRKGVVKWKVQIKRPIYSNGRDLTMRKPFHTIASLKKKTTKYMVRNLTTNSYYNFRILGYTKRKGKLVLTYRTSDTQLYALTGISQPAFTYGDWYDYYYTPTEIELMVDGHDVGIDPDYLQIYRKNLDISGSAYQKIATIKASQNMYMDTSVEPGKTYRYKVRGYKVVNGKRVYSEFSRTETISAVNQTGTFSLKKISSSDKKHTLEVKLTSDDKYNDDLRLMSNYYNFKLSIENDPHSDHPLQLLSYSTDGMSWTDVNPSKTDITLKGGDSIYLKLKNIDSNKLKISDAAGLYMLIVYGGNYSYLTIPFDGSAKSEYTDLC